MEWTLGLRVICDLNHLDRASEWLRSHRLTRNHVPFLPFQMIMMLYHLCLLQFDNHLRSLLILHSQLDLLRFIVVLLLHDRI